MKVAGSNSNEGDESSATARGPTTSAALFAKDPSLPSEQWLGSNCIVTCKWMTMMMIMTTESRSRSSTTSRRASAHNLKNMAMNFAAPFVLVNLICWSMATASAASVAASASSSFLNEPTNANLPSASMAAAQLPLKTDTLSVQEEEEKKALGSSSSEGAKNIPEMSATDMDYYYHIQKDEHSSNKWPPAKRNLVAMNQQRDPQPQQQPPQTDFQDHFYLNQKFKEKDVPVPFTFSNFKRQQQQPSSYQGQYGQQQQPSPARGRSSWSSSPPSGGSGNGGQDSSSFTREITIKQGRVKGIVRTMHHDSGLRDVDQFLGLPYAESPVGNKRFMPPGGSPTWPNVRLANKLPPVCPQKLPKFDMTGGAGASISNGRYNQLKRLLPYLKVESEDCLYLNLYVPRLDGKPIPKKYPVMVFIHGESYEWNSGNAYDGSVLASYGQVIVVTVNYRLGILGFLKPSMNQHTVSNFGLLDQMAALHWIKGNIGAFGGDNSAVTLMGHGTGAALVNLLMVCPVAKGLFQRAILMSGSALSDWAITTHALQSTLQVTQGLNCPLSDDQEEVLSCLRRKRYQEILNVKTSSPEFSTTFGPVIDGLFIPNEPHIVMGEYTDLFSRYDLMFGVTELESYHQLNAAALEHGLLERDKNNLLRFYMQNRFEIRPDVALVETLKEYTDSYTDPKRAKAEEHRETLLEILSDARVVSPLIQTGLYHAKVNPRTYMYVFGHNSEAGDYSHLPLSVIGEELAYVFGAPLCDVGPFPRTFSKQERLLSEATMKYWSNFAKTGNPKAPWKDLFINLSPADWQKYDVDWSEYEPVNRTFLNLGLPPVIQHRYREKYANFWNGRLPEVLRNIKNFNLSPPYAEYYPMSANNQEQHQASTPSPPASSRHPFIDGKINLFPGSNRGRGGGGGSVPSTEDPYKLLQLMGRNPGGYHNFMAHPDVSEEGGRGLNEGDSLMSSTTERIIIVGSDVVVQTADVTLYLLIFVVVLLLLLVAALGIVLRRAYRNKSKEATTGNSNKNETMSGGLGAGGLGGGGRSLDNRSTSDIDESYVLSMRPKKPTASSSNKYESMNFCRSLLEKYHQRRRKKMNQTFNNNGKATGPVSEWMTTEELAKYSPRFDSKSSLNTTTRHSSFLGTGGSAASSSLLSPLPEKVSVAIDATPQARSDSVLRQEPIEITRANAKANYLHKNNKNNERIIICQEIDGDMQEHLHLHHNDDGHDNNENRESFSSYSSSFSSSSSGGGGSEEEEKKKRQSINSYPLPALPLPTTQAPPVPPHGQYEEMMEMNLGDDEQVTSFIIDDHQAENKDINVTCREASIERDPLSPTETLENMQRRKFPKVLPDYHPANNSSSSKRHSLPSLINGNSSICAVVPIDVQEHPPAAAAPHAILSTATLGRRGSNHQRYRRPPSRMLIGASATQMATEPPPKDDEPPAISSSTLIVGPLVKKSTESIYTTLKRRNVEEQNYPPAAAAPPPQQPRKMMPLPSSASNSSNDSIATVKQMQLL